MKPKHLPVPSGQCQEDEAPQLIEQRAGAKPHTKTITNCNVAFNNTTIRKTDPTMREERPPSNLGPATR